MKILIKSRCNKIYEIGVELREIKGKLEKFSSNFKSSYMIVRKQQNATFPC